MPCPETMLGCAAAMWKLARVSALLNSWPATSDCFVEVDVATTVISKTGVPAARNEAPASPPNLRTATDDEILNLSPRAISKKQFGRPVSESPAQELEPANSRAVPQTGNPAADAASPAESSGESLPGPPEEFRAALEEHPELRSAWEDAAAYRESFASPEEAREATRLVGDLNRLDALFFSSRPEDHAELARVVSELDPAAATSLAWALSRIATEAQSHRDSKEGTRDGNAALSNVARLLRGEGSAETSTNLGSKDTPFLSAGPSYIADAGASQERAGEPNSATARPSDKSRAADRESQTTSHDSRNSITPAQSEFFHAANAATVEGVLDAIHAQVDRLLPEGTSQAARNRVVGEIYRELDTSLRSNRQLSGQLRQAFKSGTLDAAHQRSIVSLITSRARQALPGVAKRVMNEWTAALVSSGADRRARQRAAESRVDIGGSGRSGAEGRRALSPREIDYSRLSDADILNL